MATQTRTFEVLKDNYDQDVGGADVWANGNELDVGLTFGQIFRALVKLNSNWSGVAQIISAELHIRVKAVGGSSRVKVRRVTSDWDEDPPNGTAFPSTTATGEADSGAIGGTGWITIDVTVIYDSFAPASVLKSTGGAGGNASNFGLRIASFNEASSAVNTTFHSRESSYDPYVVLTYNDNHAPAAPGSLQVNSVATGSTIVGASDPVVTATYSDADGDAFHAYQIDVDQTTGAGVQPDWASPIYSTTVIAPDGSIVGSNVTKTLTGLAASWVRGNWYAVRMRMNDATTYGAYSYFWFRVNRLPTTGLTEPSATGRIGKLSYTPGSGWASPRLNVVWSYADADAQAQTKYQVFIKNDSDGSTFYDSGQVASAATSLVVPATFIENSKYRVKVQVFDGVEWSGYSTEFTIRVRWGLATHKKDVSIAGAAPTSWQVTTLSTTTGASSAVSVEYNSADDSAGTNLAATWAASLATLTKRKWVQYRVWLLSWGASPSTSPSLDKLVIVSSGLSAQPDNWLPNPITGVGGAIELSDHAVGSQSLRIAGNGTSRVVYQAVAVDPNTDYVLQARVKSIGNSGAYVAASDATDMSSPLASTTALTADSDWMYNIAVYFNSGARLTVYIGCIVTGASGTAGLFDMYKLERGRVASPWVPGFVGDAVVLDAGGVNIDASSGGVFRLRGIQGAAADVVDLGDHGLRLNGFEFGAGTAFPTAALTAGDRFYRTDLAMEFAYDGTRWLSTALFSIFPELWAGGQNANIAATTASYRRGPSPHLKGGSDIWLVDYVVSFYVVTGGTALGASHKWNGQLVAMRDNTNLTEDNKGGTANIDSGTSVVTRRVTVAVNALLNNGTVHDYLAVNWTKTGTPGNLQEFTEVTYRIVAT